MKKGLLIILFFIRNIAPGFSQTQFEICTTQNDYWWAHIAAGKLGGIFAMEDTGEPNEICMVARIDDYGNLQWSKRYFFTGGSMVGTNILTHPDGGFSIVGAGSFQNGFSDYCLIRADSNGQVVWAKYYDHKFRDLLWSTILTSENEYLITGQGRDSGSNVFNPGIDLIKIDEAGNIVFANRYYTFGYQLDRCRTQEMSDSTYIIASYFKRASGNQFSPRTLILRVGNSGNIISTSSLGDYLAYDTTDYNIGVVAPSPNGGFILSGVVHLNNYGGNFVTKLDSAGIIEWAKVYTTNTLYMSLPLIIKTASENYLMAGVIDEVVDSSNLRHILLSQFDSTGSIQWAKAYKRDTFSIEINELAITKNQWIVVSGQLVIIDGNSMWSYLMQTDSSGNSACGDTMISIIDSNIVIEQYSPTVNDSAIFVTATNFSVFDSSGISFIDFCQLISGYQSIHQEPREITLYPNPFHSSAKLIIGNNDSDRHWEGNVSCLLKIYNTHGTLVCKEHVLNINSYILHRGSLSEGLYFYQLTTNDNKLIGTGKFVIE